MKTLSKILGFILVGGCCQAATLTFKVHNVGTATVVGEFSQTLPGVYSARGVLDFTLGAGQTGVYSTDDGGSGWPSFGGDPYNAQHPLTLGIYTQSPCQGNGWTATYIVGAGGSFELYLGGAAPQPKTRLTWTIPNNSGSTVYYYIANGTPDTATADGGDPVPIPPGGLFSQSIEVDAQDAANWRLYEEYIVGSGTLRTVGILNGENGTPPTSVSAGSLSTTKGTVPTGGDALTGGFSGSVYSQPAGGVTQDQLPTGTIYNSGNTGNSPIVWSADSSTNVNSAIKNMGAALYTSSAGVQTALQSASTTAHTDASSISAALGTVGNDVTLATSKLDGDLVMIDGVLVQIKATDDGILTAVQNQTTVTGQKLDALSANLNGTGISNAINQLSTTLTSVLNEVGTNIATHDDTMANVFSNSLASFSSSLTNADVLGNLSAISNFLSDVGSTNADIATETTLAGISKTLSGMASNGVASTGTNIFSLTNMAQENTLEGISNLLANGSAANIQPSDEQSKGQAAASDGVNALQRIAGSMSAPNQAERYGTPLDGWLVSIPYGASYTIDLNPFHMEWVVSLAAFVRNLVAWIFAAGLVYRNASGLISAIQSLGATRQASASGQAILGVNANLATALICAGLITATMLAVPVYFTDWFSANNLFSVITNNPFHNASGGTLANSIWMADQFFPLSYMVWCVVTGILFKLNLAPVIWLVQTITRFLVG